MSLLQRRLVFAGALVSLPPSLAGCRAIADIFKAGVWVGVVAVVFLVAIVGGLAALLGRRT